MSRIISFIVPVYNTKDYVLRCLKSLLNQDIRKEDYEVLVIIDGSPDDSFEIVSKFAENYNNIRIIQQENKGLSETRNIGLKNINSEYVWFIDSDDWITEFCLSELIHIMSENKLDMFGIAPSIPYQSDFKKIFNKKESLSKILTGKDRLLSGDYVIGVWSYIFRLQFLLKNNLWFMKGVYFEDEEFIPRALFYAQKVMMLTHFSVYSYFIRENSITKTYSEKTIYDKLLVAKSLYNFSNKSDVRLDKKLSVIFYRKAVNIVLAGINEIKANKAGIKYLNAYLKQAKNAEMYPFDSKNTKWKTKILLEAWNHFPTLCYKIKF